MKRGQPAILGVKVSVWKGAGYVEISRYNVWVVLGIAFTIPFLVAIKPADWQKNLLID